MRSTSLRAARLLLVLALLLPLAALGTFPQTKVQAQSSDLIITGVIDGPLSGGVPKAVELYVVNNIADLGSYGIGSANNGDGSDGEEFTFPADSATAGDFLYVASETTGFTDFFGFAPDYTSGAAEINGDDAIELFRNSTVVDILGDINVDGSGQPWDHADGWAYRNNGTGPDGSSFVLSNWSFSGADALDGATSNATASNSFPVGTFSTTGGGETGQAFPLEENFDSCDLTGWQIISVDADTANTWECSDTFSNTEANGFGNSAPAEEWLITPPLNMDAQTDEILNFDNVTRFTDSGVAYPQLSVLYSSDYTGSGDPNAANWTELSGINYSAEDSDTPANSGDIDLSAISGDSVYFAFRYTSSGTSSGSAARWRIDSISFTVDTGVDPPDAALIHAIQGDGADSPLDGQSVTVEAIVVGDFQDGVAGTNGDLNGFYIQEEDNDIDTDPATSEGLFIEDGSSPGVDVSIGDLVQVSGEVEENFGRTQLTNLSNVAVISSGNPLPATTAITLPVSAIDDFEAYENMLVTFPQELTISEYFNFDRFGEIVLALPAEGEDRPFQPTNLFEPGSTEATARQDLNDRSRITLDDGRSNQNPDPARHPNGNDFTLENRFRGGDTVADATGVLDYSFSLYRIQPTDAADYTARNSRPEQPEAVGGSLKVVSFNVLNYFTTLDDSGDICGPSNNLGCRGADDANEFQRQRDKIISALLAIDADIVGLIEIENNATASLQDLVDGLNAEAGAGTYAFVDTGTIGSDAIKVAFIYKPATVSTVGSFAVLDTPAFVNPNTPDPKNRPALAQTFEQNSNNETLTVVVNHLKSKGSGCGAGDDDTTTGQGNCNLTRTLAAQELVDWLATDPTGSNDPDFLIIGDLNAYAMEDPIMAVQAGADDTAGTADDYSNLIRTYQGPLAYSFVFSGQFGYLDHALANASLAAQVTGVTEWYINADEPDILDYDTTFKQEAQDALYEDNAFRSSDHDPVIVGLNLRSQFLSYMPFVSLP